MRRSCHTLSNAFGMSRNTSPMGNWNKQSNISGYEIKTKRNRDSQGGGIIEHIKGGRDPKDKKNLKYAPCWLLDAPR